MFYTKEVEKENYLKTQFKEKYPTCYEAIFQIKGGKFYSEQYKDFPALMTEIETSIFFKVNMDLIKLGYDVISIYDSLYSDSVHAIKLGKEMIIKEMQQFGITPLLKDINYQIPALLAPKQPIVDVHIKKDIQGSPAKENENSVKQQNKQHPKEIEKPAERFLNNEAKEKGLQELDYFIDSWAPLIGLEMAYQMYEDQFKGMDLKPKVLLKAV